MDQKPLHRVWLTFWEFEDELPHATNFYFGRSWGRRQESVTGLSPSTTLIEEISLKILETMFRVDRYPPT